MVKVAFLSGAYKNAGDFLIEARSLRLLHHFVHDISIDKFLRNELSGKCEQLNGYDAIVIGGGPIYSQNIEKYLPIAEMTGAVKKPIMIIGGGWYGAAGGYQQIYRYKFSEQSRAFLSKVDREGYGLSCRDIYTYRTLKKEGYQNVWLTGCPAWYNIDTLAQTGLRGGAAEINSIIVSDPARKENAGMAVEVLRLLRKRYKKAKITFIFHRGYNADRFTAKPIAERAAELRDSIRDYCDDIMDISYGESGFSAYDTCDLHVGFRVHAHIYCLSMRNRSILIEEDGRGAGVNQILGFPALKAYSDSIQTDNYIYNRAKRKLGLFQYQHVTEDLDSYLDILSMTGAAYFENAFHLQQQYFKTMGEFIGRLDARDGGRKA